MYLDCNKSLNFISALALTLACGCSSKTPGNGDQGVGGSGCANGAAFCLGTGGGTSISDAGTFDPATYCNGLFQGLTCTQTRLTANIKTVNMLLVIDESGSMNDIAGTATASKWSEMKQALSAALTQPKVQDNINFGLELFPFDPNGPVDTAHGIAPSCAEPTGAAAISVDIAPGAANLQTILGVVNQQTPAGGTPTEMALENAFAYFTQGAGKDLTGRYVLLATDGGPNCNAGIQCAKDACTQNMDLQCGDKTATTPLNCCDPALTGVSNSNMSCLDSLAVVSEIAKLAGAGISTYVIGIPGSEAYASTLNSMAQAGAVPNQNGANGESYYAVSASNSLADLQKAFEDITTKLVTSCDIELSTTPTTPDAVRVAKDCLKVPMLPGNKPPAADGGVTDGFYIDYSYVSLPSPTPAHLILTGNVCVNISTQGAHNLDVIVGCVGTQ